MTARSAFEDADEPWRFMRQRGLPKRDLGPAAAAPPGAPLHPLLGVWSSVDEFVLEAVEIAAVLAEEAVHSFLATRSDTPFQGRSAVIVRFLDAPTLSSFRRTRAVAPTRDRSWRLVRRWALADRDGGLDEAMCCVVAKYLNLDFSGLLRAHVVTWVD